MVIYHSYVTVYQVYQRVPLFQEASIWVCLKMLCTPKPNGFADHYPYEKWLFHWDTQHFQTNPNHEIWFSWQTGTPHANIMQISWYLQLLVVTCGHLRHTVSKKKMGPWLTLLIETSKILILNRRSYDTPKIDALPIHQPSTDSARWKYLGLY